MQGLLLYTLLTGTPYYLKQILLYQIAKKVFSL